MKITKIEDSDKINFLELLLLADEELKMLEKYLYRGEMFALYDENLKSVCVVTQESENVCELKNIATDEKWQGKGYGSKLLNHIFSHYKGKYTTMLVGCIFRLIRTVNPDLSGHGTGNIRTVIRRHPDTCRAI